MVSLELTQYICTICAGLRVDEELNINGYILG